MDDPLIYVKTPAGEATLLQRTRLLQRNLRMVLINVDGLATVSELKRRLGDSNMVESSLSELLRLALIEISSGERREPEETATAPGFLLERQQVETPSTLDAPTVIEGKKRSAAPFSAFYEKLAQWRERRKAATEEKAFRKIYEMPTEADTIEQVKLKRVRRGPRRVISWPLLLVMILAGGVFLLTLLAMLFPYQRYLPEMERRLSLALHDPVRIARAHFSVLPYPNITLEGISVGAEAYVTARAVRIVPNLFLLFAEMPVLSDVQVDGLMIRGQGILRSANWLRGATASDGGVRFQEVKLDDLAVEIGDATLDGLSGKVQLSAKGGIDKFVLQNVDHTLHLEVAPAAFGYRLSVLGNNWMMPFRPRLMLENFEAQGELSPGSLRFSRINGRMYEGIFDGTAQFDWSQATTLVSDINLSRASISKMFVALNPDLALQGDISGKLHLESRADGFSHLVDSLRVDGDFLVANGIINHFDLVEALRSNRQTRGGFTRFERFSGSLQLEHQDYHLNRLKISSGLMQASGNLDIGPKQEIKGTMELSLKGSATLVKGSVGIAGTLNNPQISPVHGANRGGKISP